MWSFLVTWLMVNTAITVMGVVLAFALKKPSFFLKKANGLLSPASYLIFWPYFMLNTITLVLFRVFSQENVLDEVFPNLYMGSKLYEIDYKLFVSLGIKSTLDLTSEFSETDFVRQKPNYLCLPVLDTSAPTLDQLEEAVEWISAHLLEGPVYVHCALGHGRSATVVAGFLIKNGRVNDVNEAIELLKTKRSGIDLHPKQLSVLKRLTRRCILTQCN